MTISKQIKIFDVSGRFLIPGTREVAKFSARVIAESRHQGSKDLAQTLHEKFGEKLPRGFKFSGDFALYHLQWKEHAPKVKDSVVLEAMKGLTTNVVDVSAEVPVTVENEDAA